MSDTRTRVKKPHPLAERAPRACWRCGYDWLRPVLDMSDPEAEEIPTYMGCARCKAKPAAPPTGGTEP